VPRNWCLPSRFCAVARFRGRSLLYTYRKDGSFQVFSLDLVNRQELQLTFSAGDKYDLMPLSGGPPQQGTKFPEAGLFLEEPTLSPDGKWLVYARNNGGSSLWLLELGSSPRSIQ